MLLVSLADPVHLNSVSKQHACCCRYSPMDISKAAKMLQVSVSQPLPLLCLHSGPETATPAGWHRAGHLSAALRGPHTLPPPVQGGEHAPQSALASACVSLPLATPSRPSAHPRTGCCQPPTAGATNCRKPDPEPLDVQIDFNLYGMGAVRLSKVKFRPPIPDAHAPHRPGWLQAPIMLAVEPELLSKTPRCWFAHVALLGTLPWWMRWLFTVRDWQQRGTPHSCACCLLRTGMLG